MQVEKGMLSRLLYPQPVCVLTTRSSMMVVSWITPIDNHGRFVMSINLKRFTLMEILELGAFCLNVAPKSMQDKVLQIGSCSSETTNKLDAFGLTKQEHGDFVYLVGMAANLFCNVQDSSVRDGHQILFCSIAGAIADPAYWNGKQLYNDQDPLLSFLGTKKFAYMRTE
jgi:flavin reductase (DIM6/NTAB) family NADH-FMN oxidoreductase RutF